MPTLNSKNSLPGAGGDMLGANNLSELTNITTAKTKLLLNLVDNTSDATKNAAAATLENKKIVGSDGTADAVAGNLGEYVESAISLTALGTTAVVADVTSITLTAGDWDISYSLALQNTLAVTVDNISIWIGTASGTSTAGQDVARNYSQAVNITSTAGWYTTLNNPVYRVLITSTTTYYAKVSPTYTGGTQNVFCNIKASRRR